MLSVFSLFQIQHFSKKMENRKLILVFFQSYYRSLCGCFVSGLEGGLVGCNSQDTCVWVENGVKPNQKHCATKLDKIPNYQISKRNLLPAFWRDVRNLTLFMCTFSKKRVFFYFIFWHPKLSKIQKKLNKSSSWQSKDSSKKKTNNFFYKKV